MSPGDYFGLATQAKIVAAVVDALAEGLEERDLLSRLFDDESVLRAASRIKDAQSSTPIGD